MSVYLGYVDGLVRETSYGTSAIPTAGTETYLWGLIAITVSKC